MTSIIGTLRDKMSLKKTGSLATFLIMMQTILAQNFDLKYIVKRINPTTMEVTVKIVGEDDGLPIDFLDGGLSVYNTDRSNRSYTATFVDAKTRKFTFPIQSTSDSALIGMNYT